MAVDWTEVGYVVAGAVLTSYLRKQVFGVPQPAPPTKPRRPASCIRTPRFVEHNGQCRNVIDNMDVEQLWCDQQERASADDPFYWPWSSPECE